MCCNCKESPQKRILVYLIPSFGGTQAATARSLSYARFPTLQRKTVASMSSGTIADISFSIKKVFFCLFTIIHFNYITKTRSAKMSLQMIFRYEQESTSTNLLLLNGVSL